MAEAMEKAGREVREGKPKILTVATLPPHILVMWCNGSLFSQQNGWDRV